MQELLQAEWARPLLGALALALAAIITALAARLVRAIEGSSAASEQLSTQELRERIYDQAVAAAEGLGGTGPEKLQKALDIVKERGLETVREEAEAALMRAATTWRIPQWVADCAEGGAGLRLE